MISRLRAKGSQSPEQRVDGCLDLMGPLEVTPESHKELVDFAGEKGEIRWDTEEVSAASTERVGELLQLIVSLREYQYA